MDDSPDELPVFHILNRFQLTIWQLDALTNNAVLCFMPIRMLSLPS